jgi:hypothetical protein
MVAWCKYFVMFLMLFPFVAIGNMLGNDLGTLEIYLEVKGTWCKHHGNLWETLWEHQNPRKKTKQTQNQCHKQQEC